MRRHFEGAHLEQSQATAAAFRRKQFVDAEFGAVRVAAGIDEKVAE
jgi:hypothetical protein